MSGALNFTLATFSISKPTVTGGTLTSDATYYYRTFTGTDSLIVTNASIYMDVLVVAGGGGGSPATGYAGGSNGGGGAGGLEYRSNLLIPKGTYGCSIGGGGPTGSNGFATTFSLPDVITSVGGGTGGWQQYGGYTPGTNGGSGGGGASGFYTNGSTTMSGTGAAGQGTVSSFMRQGYNGGVGAGYTTPSGGVVSGGGGGGAGSVGEASFAGPIGSGGQGYAGDGGSGASYFGSTFARGGEGDSFGYGMYVIGKTPAVTPQTANTGNGGKATNSGNSGLVKVRYLKTAVSG